MEIVIESEREGWREQTLALSLIATTMPIRPMFWSNEPMGQLGSGYSYITNHIRGKAVAI